MFLWSAALKDLRRLIRDPAALLIWLAIPTLIGTLMFLAFGGQTSRTPVALLLVADRDSTFVSRLLVEALNRIPVVETRAASLEEGLARLGSGKGSALLSIPKGFGDALLDQRPTTLSLRTNPAQRILPGIIEESLRTFLEAAFYAQTLLAEPLREIRSEAGSLGSSPSTEALARATRSLTASGAHLSRYLSPPIVALETVVEERQESPGFGVLFLPGLLFMTLLFVADGLSHDIWRERLQGTLRRTLTTPRAIWEFLAGKLLASALVIAGICLIATPLEAALFGLRADRLPLALLWSVISGISFFAAFLLIKLLATNQRAAGMLTTMILFPLLMVGGSFFPFEAMPQWLARIGRLTPNGWALEQLKAILGGSVEPAGLAAATAGLLVFGLACFLLAGLRLRRGFAVS